VGKPEEMKTGGRLRSKSEDNIEMKFKEMIWECVGFIYLAQTKHKWWTTANTIISLCFPPLPKKKLGGGGI
jgi:hypothetical protein